MMKKGIAITLIAIMFAFVLTGCGKNTVVVEQQKDIVDTGNNIIELNYDTLEINTKDKTITYQITCYVDNTEFGITPKKTVNADDMRYTFSNTNEDGIIYYIICNWEWDTQLENYNLNVKIDCDDTIYQKRQQEEEQRLYDEAMQNYMDILNECYK